MPCGWGCACSSPYSGLSRGLAEGVQLRRPLVDDPPKRYMAAMYRTGTRRRREVPQDVLRLTSLLHRIPVNALGACVRDSQTVTINEACAHVL